MISAVGPKLNSRVSHSGVGGVGGWALMVTWCCSRRGSRSWPANAGRWVEKWVALSWPDPALTALRVTPVIASPGLVTLMTLSAWTCCLKTLYGITTDFGGAGASTTLVMKMLSSSRIRKVSQKRPDLIGARPPDGGF